jgi:hypothetical protein
MHFLSNKTLKAKIMKLSNVNPTEGRQRLRRLFDDDFYQSVLLPSVVI